MGKESAYYNALDQKRRRETNNLKKILPQHAHGFVEECLIKHELSTAFNYTQDLHFFYQYIKDSNPMYSDVEIRDIPFDAIKNLGPQDINEFQNYIAEGHKPDKKGISKPVKERSVARKMATIRNYFKYLVKFDYLENDPTLKAVTKRVEKESRKVRRLDSDQVKMLVNSVENVSSVSERQRIMSEHTAKRDLAIITLLLNTGMRVSECVGLDLSDVNFDSNTVKIVRKGGFEDELYLNENIRNTLRDYINSERPTLLSEDDPNEPALFISLKHKRLSVRSIQHMIEKYGQNTGLDEKLTPHKLRRTYGTALYNKTGDIYMVADVLGHSDINTTSKHYAAIEEEHKRQASQVDIYGSEQNNE